MKRRFKVKSIEIPANRLRLKSTMNRELRPARVRWLEKNMNADLLRFAVWRDGRDLWVIDGQHRKVALENLGLGDWPVLCDVYEGCTFAEACDLFLGINNGLVVRPFDKFDKGVKAGYEECVETAKIVEQAGLRISPQAGDGKVICVAACTEVYRMDRGPALEKSLLWSTSAWGHTAQAVEGHLVKGLGLVAARFPNGELDNAALVLKLSKFSGGPGGILGRAKAQRDIKGRSVGHNVGQVVIDIYNKGRRNGQLPPL